MALGGLLPSALVQADCSATNSHVRMPPLLARAKYISSVTGNPHLVQTT